jgi:16S rRNA (uracil1498-N3)-methyltransferase
MSSRRFFTHHPPNGNTLRISGDEAHHLKHVNRAKCGDSLEVIDGQGSLFYSTIRAMKADEVILQVEREEKCPKPPVRLIIAPSLVKQRSMNIMVEKLTEIGVDEIRPVIFSRTDETYHSSRLKKWQRLAAQSLKVNKELWLTALYPPVSLNQILTLSESIETKLLLDLDGEKPVSSTALGEKLPVIAVIGPPGDLVPEERQHLIQKGFIPRKINSALLKTETAAISIAAILSLTR